MIAVALAGGAGAASRLVFDGLVRERLGHRLPWGTLIVNILGSLALGWLVGTGAGTGWMTIAGTGYLGGFTTFSAASFESARMALDHHWGAGVTHALGTLVLCVGAAALGYAVGS